MTIRAHTILTDALHLSPMDRAAIIEELIASFDEQSRKRTDRAWAVESEIRIDAVEKRLLTERPFEEVVQEINS